MCVTKWASVVETVTADELVHPPPPAKTKKTKKLSITFFIRKSLVNIFPLFNVI